MNLTNFKLLHHGDLMHFFSGWLSVSWKGRNKWVWRVCRVKQTDFLSVTLSLVKGSANDSEANNLSEVTRNTFKRVCASINSSPPPSLSVLGHYRITQRVDIWNNFGYFHMVKRERELWKLGGQQSKQDGQVDFRRFTIWGMNSAYNSIQNNWKISERETLNRREVWNKKSKWIQVTR